MKRVISLIIGILAISGITGLTIYTLQNKGLKEDISSTSNKEIELVTSTYNGSNLSELYNVYLNNQKHKLKFEYRAQVIDTNVGKIGSLELIVYFDGGSIIHEEIVNNINAEEAIAEEFFKNTNVSAVKLNLEDIKKTKINDKEYILLALDYYDIFNKSKYFLFDDKGDLLVNNGSLIKDNSIHYLNKDNTELNIFYGSNTSEQIMAKYEDGAIFAIEPIVNPDNPEIYTLIECKYYYQDNEIIREELNTYPEVISKSNPLPNANNINATEE